MGELCEGLRCWLPLSLYYIEGVGILTVGTIGLAINLAAMKLLVCAKPRHIFHHVLLSLTIYDFLQISLSIACFALPQLSPWYQDAVLIHSIPFLIPLAQMTLSGSSFTTVALTVERYISLCSPYLRYTYNIRAQHFILPVLVFSTLYNMPRFFEWRTHTESYEVDCRLAIVDSSATGASADDQTNAWIDEDFIDQMITQYGGDIPESILETIVEEGLVPMVNGSDIFNLQVSDIIVDDMSQSQRENEISSNNKASESIYDLSKQSQSNNCSITEFKFTLVARSLRKNKTYVLIYISWMNFIINLLCPLVTMFVMNLAVYKDLRKLWSKQQSTYYMSNKRPSMIQDSCLSPLAKQRSNSWCKHSPVTPHTGELELPRSTRSSTSKSLLLSTPRTSHAGIEGDTISNTCSSQGGDHQEREQNVRYTRASIIMVVMYFFCHAPRLLPCTAEIFMERKDMPPWLELMISVNHLLVVTNSSFNFLIYLMASKSQNSQNCCFRLLNYCLGLRRHKELRSSSPNQVIESRAAAKMKTQFSPTTTTTAVVIDAVNTTTSFCNRSSIGAQGSGGKEVHDDELNPTTNPPPPQSATNITSVLLKVTDCDGTAVSIQHPLMEIESASNSPLHSIPAKGNKSALKICPNEAKFV